MRSLSDLVLIAPSASAGAYLLYQVFGDHIRRRLTDREASRLQLSLDVRRELFLAHVVKQADAKHPSVPSLAQGRHAKRD